MPSTRDMVPPGSVFWADFFQASDPAADPANEVGPGMSWDEADDDEAPTTVVAMWRRNLDNTTWVLRASGAGGAGFIPAAEKGAASGVAQLDASGKVPVAQLPLGFAPVKSEAASYTLVLADAGHWIRCDDSDPFDLTVPPDSAVAFPVGTEVHLEQAGTGAVTVVAGAGVTIRTAETLSLGAQYAVATLKKVATDEWVLVGYLAAA